MRDSLLKRSFSVVIDSTAPDNVTRDFWSASPVKNVNQLLIIVNVDREYLVQRSIETCGDEGLILAWDKRWEDSRKDCCIFKFKSNTPEEFNDYYARLTELLESELHPFKPEFRPTLFSLTEIRKALRKFLERHSKIMISSSGRNTTAEKRS